ncbi:hypothetical protein GCM10010191_61400 [Actinomadura vinacea]|uniref:MFS transporter n=1 Tax=Actinomadura vinacea TaxID=115336 RepID=A0ABN3JR83_9ACTN
MVFVVHGLLFASWTAHIPDVKARLNLGDGSLGLALVGAPVGSVCAMMFAGALLSRVGSRTVVRLTLPGYCLAGALIGMTGSAAQLFVVLAVWGAFQGVLDIAMNAQAIAAERVRGRPIMTTVHGCWSIGALAGAGIGAGGVAAGVTLPVQLLLLGVAGMLVGLRQASRFADDPPRQSGGHREGRTSDTRWGAVLVRDELSLKVPQVRPERHSSLRVMAAGHTAAASRTAARPVRNSRRRSTC